MILVTFVEYAINTPTQPTGILWWSGYRKMTVVLPTLNWLPDDLLTEGYPNFVYKASLTLCTRRLEGLHSSGWT